MYWALFLSAFAAATVLPLASEVPLVLLVRREDQILLPVVVATLGNYLGACTTYGIARFAVARLRPARAPSSPRAVALWRRFGAPTLLLSWVPLIGDAFVLLAGAAAIPFGVFSSWTVVGKALRYAVVAWLASTV